MNHHPHRLSSPNLPFAPPGDGVEADVDEDVAFRLEETGFRTGQKLVERATRDRQRFSDIQEIVSRVAKWGGVDGKG